jgi:hypothetical protein
MFYPDYVQNLTLTIDHELLKAVQQLASDRNTTVNQMVREYLQSIVRQASDLGAARQRLLSRRYPIDEISWRRDELYQR